MMFKFLPYAKAYASLIGAIVTGLLGTYAADTEVGKVLTVIAVIATVVATWAVPNVDYAAEDVDPDAPSDSEHTFANGSYPDGRDNGGTPVERTGTYQSGTEPRVFHEDPAVNQVMRSSEYRGEHEA